MNPKQKPKHTNTSGKLVTPGVTAILKNPEFAEIQIDFIDFSPFNYRKYFSEEALNNFADELKQHGMISPITLRKKSASRYELVAGERRLRAARIAGLKAVPGAIYELTDDEVGEIQLAENIQREDPHPFHEAEAIGRMQQRGLTLDEIAARLGKSRPYIAVRLRLLNLTEDFQEMMLAGILNLNEAVQIASLSKESQTEFFTDKCSRWKKDKHFEIYNLEYFLRTYKYDLKNAPFDTKNKNLVPEAGSCTTCPFNSAALKSLFPETAKQAVCSKKACYRGKCSAHILAALNAAIETYQPAALLYDNVLSEIEESAIVLAIGGSDLPRHNIREITIVEKPAKPIKEHYKGYGGSGKRELDVEAYTEDLHTYETELENYKLNTKSGHYPLGVFVNDNQCQMTYFTLEKPKPKKANGEKITAKEVQTAIKDGTVTPEILQSEIERLLDREKRKQEIDAETVQLNIHKLMSEFADQPANQTTLTNADTAAARWLVYQSLDYSKKSQWDGYLFPGKESPSKEEIYKAFAALTDQQASFLIRLALCNKSESKYPNNTTGYFLHRMADEADIPVATVQHSQDSEAAARRKKLDIKIKQIKQHIGKLKRKQKKAA